MLALAAALLVGLAGLAATLWKRDRGVRPFTTGGVFDPNELARTYQVFDLGVTDADGDQLLDVFTVNHSNRQVLLLGRGAGAFEERLVELGLSQSADFPGVEQGLEQPAYERPGLYVHWQEEKLVLHGEGDLTATGRIELPRALRILTHGGATASPPDGTSLRFAVPGGGTLELVPDHRDFSPRLELDQGVPLESVFVGPGRINPELHAFRLPTQDRHGMAWADFDGDGDEDVFIARGGDRGLLQETDPDARDELFVLEEGRFVDRTVEAGLEKLGCPARSVCWVDATGDGLLDVFVVCGRDDPPNADAPNQLFVQGPPGRFQERARELGLDTRGLGLALWLDCELDGDMDLLWASAATTSLLRNESGGFLEEVLAPGPSGARHLSAADFDGDGDTDVYLASPEGGRVLVAEGHGYRLLEPAALGLPAASYRAYWVDFDNDGLVDVHLVPQGLYRQEESGSFTATSLLAQRRSGADALGSWADMDGDGLRDFVVAVPDWSTDAWYRLRGLLASPPRFPPRAWRVLLYRCTLADPGDWLQVELVGPPGNRPAIGARVELQSGRGVTVAEVGHADGSLRSQGHARLYFGLGRPASPPGLTVVWPDGSRRRVEVPSTRRLLVVEHDRP